MNLVRLDFAIANTTPIRRYDYPTLGEWEADLQLRARAVRDSLPPFDLTVLHPYDCKMELFELVDWLVPTYVQSRESLAEEEFFWNQFEGIMDLWKEVPYLAANPDNYTNLVCRLREGTSNLFLQNIVGKRRDVNWKVDLDIKNHAEKQSALMARVQEHQFAVDWRLQKAMQARYRTVLRHLAACHGGHYYEDIPGPCMCKITQDPHDNKACCCLC
ncbi:hypothetical protein DFP72DRAFT_1063423 [Ephemerocybe angulata]|uniref:Uncharacterized protein n=1 Tax=Ephemerocybe angulata TaxID=980116 RepID=A0A8H6I6H1_9AGAR|nr:hypothetical protein DFP72DRAFT_1063423 [Tulosesus angulatus]